MKEFLSTFLYFASAAALAVLVPVYINSLANRKPYKLKKMLCSAMFLITAFSAVMHKGGFSLYSILIVCALTLSWLGDLFLAVSMRGKAFVLGLSSFLLAHIVYVVSFSVAVVYERPIEWYEFLIVALMLLACFVGRKRFDISLGEMKIPVLFYAAVISIMLARAVRLAVNCFIFDGQSGGTAKGILMICAALLFVASDAVLVFIIFKKKNTRSFETANLVTYYLAQFLLATSIMKF